MRLGRLPHDPSRVAAVKPHVMAATEPLPLVLPRPGILTVPTLADNDTLPTCTVAGLANSARAWAQLHGFDLVIDGQKLLDFFAAIAGCEPTVAAIAETSGLVMLDVLEYAQSHGFDVGPQILVPDFSAVHMPDILGVRDAIFTRATAYVGVTLYASDEQPGAKFFGPPSGDPVGRHCVDPVRWTATDYQVATWGQDVDADEEWLMSRIDECYSIAWSMPMAAT